eukprot:s104_g14.t1
MSAKLPEAMLPPLPKGITSVSMWGRTVIDFGMFKSHRITYEDLVTADDKQKTDYVKWCRARSGTATGHLKDFCEFMRHHFQDEISNSGMLIPGTSHTRILKFTNFAVPGNHLANGLGARAKDGAQSVLRGSGRHLLDSDAGATPLAVTPPRSPAPSSIYGKIYVGEPPQEFLVVYDTGSGNMFLPDRACQSTSCMTKHTYDKLLSKAAKQVPNATSVPEEVRALSQHGVSGSVEIWDGSSGLWAGALVVLATLLVSLTCILRTPQAPQTFGRRLPAQRRPQNQQPPLRREEVIKSISSETVSTATGSGTESPRSPTWSEASVSCWPFKDLFAPCMGVSSDPSRLRSASSNWNAE